MALTLSLAICAAAAYELTLPPTFMSTATLTVDVEHKRPAIGGEQGGTGFNEDLEPFVETQIAVMKGAEVMKEAALQMQANHPDEKSSPVLLDFLPQHNLVTITASGTDPIHTQHYLEARLQGYLNYQDSSRNGFTKSTGEKFSVQILETAKALKEDNKAIIDFQRENHIFLGDGAAPSGSTLAALNQKLAVQQDEYDQLRAMTPEQEFEHPNLQHGSNDASTGGADSASERSGLETSGAEADYRQAQATLAKLKAEMDDFSRDMRPQHPKIIQLSNSIHEQQNIISSLLEQNRARIQNRLVLLASMIDSTKKDIAEAGPKELATDLLRAQFAALTEQKQRDSKTYDDLQTAMRNANLNTSVDLGNVRVTGKASVAEPVPSSWLKALAAAVLGGLLAGVGILLLIDRLDDRMGSISDFQLHFAEQVMGQIPSDPTPGNTELLRFDDDRHMLVESFRNLRSTLLFMPLEGERPKTLLVTSAIPNEGKSTISCNLALVLAFAGMKTLLIDADLRRGAIHDAFGLARDPGLTDVLRHNVKWEDAVRTTNVDNLHILPRGRNVPQPSEYLLNRATDQLLKEIYPQYDYIIIDSSPILAADDTASLAPKIDATLFVVRLSFTSAKMTRKSLEILYNRQANIPGLILNQVDTSSPEFVYYQYADYYNSGVEEQEPADSLAVRKSEREVPATSPTSMAGALKRAFVRPSLTPPKV